MTSSPANASPLRQRMVDDMRMRQLAPKTQDIYLHIVREFARFLGRSPNTATVEDLRRYQLYLVDHGTSPVSLNAAITGLKFFFETTLHEPELMARMQPVPLSSILRFYKEFLSYKILSPCLPYRDTTQAGAPDRGCVLRTEMKVPR